MIEMGEGAVSNGPMVPVFRGEDPEQVARVLAWLEAAGIPALCADDTRPVAGVLLGPVPPGTTVIVVPLRLLAEARAILRARAQSMRPPPVEVRPTTARPLPDADEEDDDGPLEEPPFEAMSGYARLTIALGACAIGALLQASLLADRGFVAVRQLLALRWDGQAFHGNAITAGFMHASSVHFLGNLAFGLLLGFVLLGTHGVGATAAVWLFASIIGIAAEAVLSPGATVLGASAGIYGLVGLWLHGELQRAKRAVLPRRAVMRALGVILLLAPGALTPFTSSGGRVAVLAHLVGFTVGLLGGVVFPRWFNEGDRERLAGRGRWATGVTVVIAGAGLIAAFVAVTQETI